jgi:hypothetical protein
LRGCTATGGATPACQWQAPLVGRMWAMGGYV